MLTSALLALGAALVTGVLALVLCYWVAPGVLFRLATVLGRRGAGLRLAHVDVDGHRIPYLDGGRGEPLVLLHGFGANKDHWTAVARLLTPHFRVIAPDLPGFGDASRRAEASYGVDAQLARLAAFTDALGLERFHLGGNSMGGYLATLFAACHPARVSSLWLLAPAGAFEAEPSDFFRLLERGDNALIATDMAAFDRLAALCFCRLPWLPARFKLPLLARAVADAPFNEKIFAELFTDPLGLPQAVARVPARTLLVWGDEDRILHRSGLDVLRPLFSDVECILMREMGHAPMLERPAETAMDFLRFHGRLA